MKNTENIRIDELLPELQGLREANEELRARNEFLERCVEALKLNLSAVTLERNKLVDKVHFLDQKCNAYHKEVLEITSMDMWEFANLYCNEAQLEEAGHQLARSLLGGK